MLDVAIVGAGIAGLGAAYKLATSGSSTASRYTITIYEQNDYAGGHANTAIVKKPERLIPIDTGFMVFNKVTYPNLTKLFEELKVPIKPTDMSFSVQKISEGLEFAGASFDRLFGQRKNLLRPRFWKMLLQLDRFNKEAVSALYDSAFENMTLQEYVDARAYGQDFLKQYLIPMSSSVWSTPEDLMLAFPAKTLLRFFHNHGFLGMDTQHQWWTIDGGSRTYVKLLIEAINPSVQLSSPVQAVVRKQNGVELVTAEGVRKHDKVIIATHADQALKLLDLPSNLEIQLLSQFAYQPNKALLHTDRSIMPKEQRCWASWNYRIDRDSSSSTHYWMNSLQHVSRDEDYFVSLNADHLVDPNSILRSFYYEHPLFSVEAAKAQETLPALNKLSVDQSVYFCGSYFRYGFHEDGLSSGYDAANALMNCVVLV